MTTRRIAVVLGTRPEIIKLAPVVEALGDDAFVVYTGQHYDFNMSDVFFEQIRVRRPDVAIGVGGRTRAGQLGEALPRLESVFLEHRPRAVVVQGDTNSVLAGALTANSLQIPVVHVEAGLRSFDKNMPEEHNRVLTDHISDVLCAPTGVSVGHLEAEQITGRIVETGNTVVDVLQRVIADEGFADGDPAEMGLDGEPYALATFHRPENVDDPQVLALILAELGKLPFRVVLPLHPRTLNQIREADLSHLLDPITVMDPVGYLEFIGLMARSTCLVSDSGGIQEEASVLGKPIVVVRQSTERPEILGTFGELIKDPRQIAETVAAITEPDRLALIAATPTPYGDGRAAQRCVEAMSAEGLL